MPNIDNLNAEMNNFSDLLKKNNIADGCTLATTYTHLTINVNMYHMFENRGHNTASKKTCINENIQDIKADKDYISHKALHEPFEKLASNITVFTNPPATGADPRTAAPSKPGSK